MLYIILVGIIVIVLILWTTSLQRSFIVMDENINNAMSQIGIQIFSQWDALMSLLDLTKGYSELDYYILVETMKMRCSITSDSSPGEVNKQEDIIAEAIGKIMNVAERYPDLKDNKTYTKMMDAVKQYENMVHTSKLIYNDSVAKLNRAISMFPASIIAGMLDFSKCKYLEVRDV